MSRLRTFAAADRVLADMHRWLERAVIGLNLCPFAKAVRAGQIHWVVSTAADTVALEDELLRELEALAASRPGGARHDAAGRRRACWTTSSCSTISVRDAERLLQRHGWERAAVGELPPGFQFADAPPDALRHCTNRAPYPTLHLLREASIDAAAGRSSRMREAIYGATRDARATRRPVAGGAGSRAVKPSVRPGEGP